MSAAREAGVATISEEVGALESASLRALTWELLAIEALPYVPASVRARLTQETRERVKRLKEREEMSR